MVFGTGAKAGAAIVQHPKIKALSFTGSTGVGKYIQEKSAPFIKKLSLEVFLAVYSTGNLLVELGWKDQKIQSNLAIIPLLSPFGVQTLQGPTYKGYYATYKKFINIVIIIR